MHYKKVYFIHGGIVKVKLFFMIITYLHITINYL